MDEIIGKTIGLMIAVFIAVPLAIPVIQNLQLPDTQTKTVFQIIPIFGIVLVAGMLFFVVIQCFSTVDEDEEGYYEDEEEYMDDAPDGKHILVKDAKEILRIRLAKGEISTEEYTDRMSRL